MSSSSLYPQPNETYSTLNSFLTETRSISEVNFGCNLTIQRRTNTILILTCSLGIKRPSRMTNEDKKKKDWCPFTISAERIERTTSATNDESISVTPAGHCFKVSSTKYFPHHNHSPLASTSTSTLSPTSFTANSLPNTVSSKRPRSNSISKNDQAFETSGTSSTTLAHGRRRRRNSSSSSSSTSTSSYSKIETPSSGSSIFTYPFIQSDQYELSIPLLSNSKRPKKRPNSDLSISEEYLIWRNVLGLERDEVVLNWSGNEGMSYRSLLSCGGGTKGISAVEESSSIGEEEEIERVVEVPSPPQIAMGIKSEESISPPPPPPRQIRKRGTSTKSRNTPSGPSRFTTRSSAKFVESIGYQVPFYLLDRENVAREEEELINLEKEEKKASSHSGGNLNSTERRMRRSNSSAESGSRLEEATSRDFEFSEGEGSNAEGRIEDVDTPDTSFEVEIEAEAEVEERDVVEKGEGKGTTTSSLVGLGLSFEEEEVVNLLMKEEGRFRYEPNFQEPEVHQMIVGAGGRGREFMVVAPDPI